MHQLPGERAGIKCGKRPEELQGAQALRYQLSAYRDGNQYSVFYELLDEKPQKVNYSVRPAGMYLIAYHKGKWQTLEDTYKKILEYGKENKIQLGAHCYEDILFDSLTMSEEEEYLTRIVFEIQSSKSGK